MLRAIVWLGRKTHQDAICRKRWLHNSQSDVNHLLLDAVVICQEPLSRWLGKKNYQHITSRCLHNSHNYPEEVNHSGIFMPYTMNRMSISRFWVEITPLDNMSTIWFLYHNVKAFDNCAKNYNSFESNYCRYFLNEHTSL